jgi:hypothetical protein
MPSHVDPVRHPARRTHAEAPKRKRRGVTRQKRVMSERRGAALPAERDKGDVCALVVHDECLRGHEFG